MKMVAKALQVGCIGTVKQPPGVSKTMLVVDDRLCCQRHNQSCQMNPSYIYSMLGYSGKWHQYSVGKFTVVYNVHIYYAMATTLVACVLLSLLCASAACLVILGNDIITLLKIHFGV